MALACLLTPAFTDPTFKEKYFLFRCETFFPSVVPKSLGLVNGASISTSSKISRHLKNFHEITTGPSASAEKMFLFFHIRLVMVLLPCTGLFQDFLCPFRKLETRSIPHAAASPLSKLYREGQCVASWFVMEVSCEGSQYCLLFELQLYFV